MSYLQAIILGFVQGLTEFLPISSSGHLVIFQKLFALSEPPVLFDILVHLGTLGAIILYFTYRFKSLNRQFDKLNWRDALLIGVFQALAIIPGISRSGATIVSALGRKLERETAFRFSFYLAVPAILGAFVLQIPDLVYSPCSYLKQGILGMIIAGITGYLTLKILERVLMSARFWFFGFYCLAIGLIVFLVSF